MKDESDDVVQSSPRTKKSDLNSREEDLNEPLLQHQEGEQVNSNVEEILKKSEDESENKNNEEYEETDEKDSSEENKDDENIENISSAGGVSFSS